MLDLEERLDKIYRIYSESGCKTFIDVGCADVNKHFLYSKYFKEITLADLQDLRGGEFQDYPFLQLDLNKQNSGLMQEYDFVNCLEVIEHVENDNTGMRMLYKLTKPGGYLCISTPNARRLSEILKKLLGIKKSWKITGHVREYTKDEFRKFVQKAGYEIIELAICNPGFYRLYLPQKYHYPEIFYRNILIVTQKPRA